MTTSKPYLLDVNVLIALIDPAHVQHKLAHDWVADQGQNAWATCLVTQNGLLGSLGHARYPLFTRHACRHRDDASQSVYAAGSRVLAG